MGWIRRASASGGVGRLAALAGLQCCYCWWWVVCADFSTCRLSGLSICWEVGGVRQIRGGGGLPRGKRTRRAAGSGASGRGWGGTFGRVSWSPAAGGGWRVPTCRLVGFSTFRLVGKSESWRDRAKGAREERACGRDEPERYGGRLQGAGAAVGGFSRVTGSPAAGAGGGAGWWSTRG